MERAVDGGAVPEPDIGARRRLTEEGEIVARRRGLESRSRPSFRRRPAPPCSARAVASAWLITGGMRRRNS